MSKIIAAACLACATTLAAGTALAQSQGDYTFGIGVGHIDPTSDGGTLAGDDFSAKSDRSIIFTFEYFIRDNLGIELLAATPFKHDLTLDGATIGDTYHLPPTLSVNWHFPTQSAWKPYVGLGINYTKFFEEDTPLGDLDLDSSFGVSAQVGLDYQFSEKNAVRFNVRWFDIDSDAKLNGTPIGTAEIDPFLAGITYVHKF